jgi:hypothetical protein
MKYVKPDRVFLRTHPQLNEKWVQDRIAEDPSILGLGDLILKDKERLHPHAGRLDLLCQDPDTNRRYEIEIQLGRTDESHIIRTLEYWDIERKRYPHFDHVAVIVAEEITGRFLNVISLFNGHIPLIAIQLQAFQIGEQISLVFTTVLNETRLGTDEEGEVSEPVDRAYWENKSSKAVMELTDGILELLQSIDPAYSLKYNRHYIGTAKDGQAFNVLVMYPRQNRLNVGLRLERSDEVQQQLEDAAIDLMDYNPQDGRYRFRLGKGELQKHSTLLRDLFHRAMDEAAS